MRRWLAAVTVAGLVLTGCGDSGDTNAAGVGITVVAAFYPVAEAVERVGGEAVEVVNLTPPGTEPHDLELTPDQVDQLEDADLVVYLGEGFQPALEAVVERRDGPTVDLLAVLPLSRGASDALTVEEAGEAGGEERSSDEIDPHFWLNPRLLSEAAEIIRTELFAVGGSDEATFAANLATYQQELADLDADFESALANCGRREIVTSHAAFFYLADRYGLAQLPIAGLSPESEPDAQRIAELSDLIKDRGITTVFYESLVSPAVARALAREARAEAAVLDPIEGLSEDDVAAGNDYSVVMRRNLGALSAALDCS